MGQRGSAHVAVPMQAVGLCPGSFLGWCLPIMVYLEPY